MERSIEQETSANSQHQIANNICKQVLEQIQQSQLSFQVIANPATSWTQPHEMLGRALN